LLASALLIVAGCGSGEADQPAPSPSRTPSASPTAQTEELTLDRWLAPGEFATQTTTYQLEDLTIPGLPAPVEVEAQVIGPVGAEGPAPLVVLMHGYTASCWTPDGGEITTDWPCPKGMEPVPSAEGFTFLQQRLASQGYLTASLRANGVNALATDLQEGAGSQERAELVNRHLAAWASGEVSLGEAWPAADLGSVLLVGHSRGGEGVDRATTDGPADAAWAVRGEVLLGPTGFEPPGESRVPVVAIAGYCDGDVGMAPAQRYVDRDAPAGLLRSSVVVQGANHNFFNAEWVPGESTVPDGYDDAFDEAGQIDPMCDPEGSVRLTPAAQQDVAMRLLGVAAAGLLRGDAAAVAALDGRLAVPGGGALIWVSAVGSGRTTLRMGEAYTATAAGGVVAEACRGVSETEDPGDCGAFDGEGSSVHWPAAFRGLPTGEFLRVHWEEPDGEVGLDLVEPLDLGAAESLELRVAVAPEGAPVRLGVGVTDSAGNRAELGEVLLDALPGGPRIPSRRWGQQVAVPLPGTGAVELGGVRSIWLAPRSERGALWVIDVSSRPAQSW
jgi:dienelactone hydrolase